MEFSERLGRIPPYIIAEVEELADELSKKKDLIRLDVGDPDFDTPSHIREALVNSLKKHGISRYSPYRGIEPLRNAISQKIEEEHGVKVDPESEVIITPGSKHAIFSSIQSTIDQRDRALVCSPVYPIFKSVTQFCGGKVVPLSLKEELGFKFDANEFKEKIKGSKIAVLNFPNNPTGGVIELEDLEEVSKSLGKKLLLYDSAYEKITFDGYNSPFPWEVEELRENTIILGSFSKTYAMTGWRVGYLIGSKENVDRILQVEKIANSSTPMFLQEACAKALLGPQGCVYKMNKEYKKRRDALVDGLNKIGLSAKKPKGTFYVFLNIKKFGKSIDFAKKLIEAGVTCVPGIGFGEEGEGYARFALTESVERIKKAVEKIGEVADAYKF